MITATSFTARWLASAGATGYRLDVAEDSAFTTFVAGFEDLDVGNVTEKLVTGLTGDTTYYARVRAYNEIGTSGNSESKAVTTTSALLDLDGNTYSYVRIGSQEWIVENFKATHYEDGSDILNIIDNNESAELLTGWTNGPTNLFDKLIAVGKIISQLEDDGSATAQSYTNLFACTAGNILELSVTVTINSGIAPRLGISAIHGPMTYYTLSAGVNKFYFKCLLTENHRVYLYNTLGSSNNCILSFACKKLGWAEDSLGAYCWYDNDIANKTPYGALYNWYAVNNSKGLVYFEKGGVEDPGWRVPTLTDWQTLKAYLGGLLVAGGKLKETGLIHWLAPNTGATNEYGFTAVPGGERDDSGGFNALGYYGEHWSSTPDEAIPERQSHFAAIYWSNAQLEVGVTTLDQGYGFSVRAVRDV